MIRNGFAFSSGGGAAGEHDGGMTRAEALAHKLSLLHSFAELRQKNAAIAPNQKREQAPAVPFVQLVALRSRLDAYRERDILSFRQMEISSHLEHSIVI